VVYVCPNAVSQKWFFSGLALDSNISTESFASWVAFQILIGGRGRLGDVMALEMRHFEVRLLKADGTPTIFMKVGAGEPSEANAQVRRMIRGDIESATIWFDGVLVGTVYSGLDLSPS